jgi:hypothetical protein
MYTVFNISLLQQTKQQLATHIWDITINGVID